MSYLVLSLSANRSHKSIRIKGNMNLRIWKIFHPGISAILILIITIESALGSLAVEVSTEQSYPPGNNTRIHRQFQGKLIRDDLIPNKSIFPYYDRSIGAIAKDAANEEGIFRDSWPVLGEILRTAAGGGPPPTQSKEKEDAKIYYFVRRNTSTPMWSNIQDKTFKVKEHWNLGGPIKVIIHGFTPDMDSSPEEKIKGQRMYDIGNAYVAKSRQNNIIIVDWTSLSTYHFLKYYEAANCVKYAAKDLAKFLIWLKDKNGLIADWKDIHLIGFSLGAHIAGGAGQRILKKTRSRVGRITGIDPAGPLFHENGNLPPNRDNVLDWSDAEFVDVIHCNMGWDSVSKNIPNLDFDFGKYGTPAQSGHADFYPNGGVVQKGCVYLDDKFGCSHGKCLGLFLRTIKENLLACPCDNWEEYKNGKCKCTTESGGVFIGDPVDQSARNRYYSN